MKERILLLGPPSGGKTYQIIKTYLALKDMGIEMPIIDMEDKVEAGFISQNLDLPKHLFVCIEWTEYKEAVDKIVDGGLVKEGGWIAADRIDLTWSRVQNWYTEGRYKQEVSDKLMESAVKMGTKSSMFMPLFDQGSWQVINAVYDNAIQKLLYKSRCNILVTSGLAKIQADDSLDGFARVGYKPKGQKDLAHQPHSAFLLQQKKEGREDINWYISTAKDLDNRIFNPDRTSKEFKEAQLFDFFIQYIGKYWTKS